MSIQSGRAAARVSLCACGLLLGLTALADPKEPLPEGGETRVAAAANVFSSTAGAKEAVPLIVAIASSGKAPVHVPKIDAPWVELYDANGRRVMGDPVPTPPQPPGTWYMRKQGKLVLTTPVWRIDPGSGAVLVVPDALERYHKHIGKGIYTIRVRVGSGIYDPSSIIKREDVEHKLWVEASTRPTGPRGLTANEIQIRIK